MRNPVAILCLVTCALLYTPTGHCADDPVVPQHRVSLPEAHKGTLAVDTLLLDSFGAPPEELREFYLQARQVLFESPTATIADSAVVEAARSAGLPLLAGPMLGELSAHGVTVWLRPSVVGPMAIQVGSKGANRAFPFDVAEPGAVMRVGVAGLVADTAHTYTIVNEAGEQVAEGAFRTAPGSGSTESLRIAFGSCFHKIGVHNPNLMRLVAERGNRAMLLLGDLAVDDREARFNEHYADYLLRDVSQAWRDFTEKVPVYASWDDHDYLNNDKSGLQRGRITDEDRRALRLLWQENWVNPQTEVADRGIYFNTVVGDVEIIMLDTRSCREWERRGERGAYLGDNQMQWLFKTLKASKATFIIMTSGTMWSDYMSRAKDSWGTWDIPGREEIFDFIEANQVGGVLLLSGDRHGARGFTIQRPSGFKLHEFEAATLGGVRGPGAFAPDQSSQLYGYAAGLKAFGEFTFDSVKADPEVTFRLIGEDGNALEEHLFRRSELCPEPDQKID
jgi:alkaline phosphatase D